MEITGPVAIVQSNNVPTTKPEPPKEVNDSSLTLGHLEELTLQLSESEDDTELNNCSDHKEKPDAVLDVRQGRKLLSCSPSQEFSQ